MRGSWICVSRVAPVFLATVAFLLPSIHGVSGREIETPQLAHHALVGDSVTVESKNVAPGAAGVTVGIFLRNTVSLRGVVIPLVIRSIDPGAFITSLTMENGRGRMAGVLTEIVFSNQYATADGSCKAGLPGGFGTVGSADFVSPDGILFMRQKLLGSSLFPGSDPSNDPSFRLTVNVTNTNGRFEIDTTCTNPNNHLLFIDQSSLAVPVEFTKGIITIGNLPTCACDCFADPQCDGFTNVLDVVHAVNIAFKGNPDIADANPQCPRTTTDVDCNGFTNVLDVVRLVNVAFKGGSAATEFCDPCP